MVMCLSTPQTTRSSSAMNLELNPQEIEPSVSSPINVDNTLGAMFIGAFIDAMYAVFNALCSLSTYACRSLYGILSLQCYIFFSIFSKDIKLLKASVCGSLSTVGYIYESLCQVAAIWSARTYLRPFRGY